ncbi:putative bromodomain associated domain protein [Rosellinia necatrix]|uniref:Putative bromodomain associated domain protein n=1 Tax=Rosellinia necatrix TaxID=77044 RepID=A0A1S7UJP8_ROSNE|nr:putative bromodomain associated domain protein [Rosellinia necatrix]
MASYNGHRPYTPSEIHLALLRPAILQILRAQGYYASTPSTIDCLTEIAGQYLYTIAKRTAENATMNNYLGPPGTPDVVDVRLALEYCGALWPGADPAPPAKRRRLSRGDAVDDDDHDGASLEYDDEEEDTSGVDEFIRWAMGRKNQRIRKIAGVVAPPGAIATGGEGEDGTVEEEKPSDYLDALKRKHNKTDQDSKYAGTILGRSIDHGEVLIEGGPDTSLAAWAARMREASLRPPDPQPTGDTDSDSRPPSSGLSSLADEEVEMMNFD